MGRRVGSVTTSPFLLVVSLYRVTGYLQVKPEYHVPGGKDVMKTACRLIKIAFIVIIILALGAGCAPGGRLALPVADRSPGSIESGYADRI
jgi:hypothetical protein